MKARFMSRQTLANTAADRWEKQYGGGHYGADKLATLARLRELGPTPNPDDIDRVIGNGSWTRECCDGCQSEQGPWVMVGEDPDYESRTATLCRLCLLEAMRVIEAEE